MPKSEEWRRFDEALTELNVAVGALKQEGVGSTTPKVPLPPPATPPPSLSQPGARVPLPPAPSLVLPAPIQPAGGRQSMVPVVFEGVIGDWWYNTGRGHYNIVRRDGQYVFKEGSAEGILKPEGAWLQGDIKVGTIRLQPQKDGTVLSQFRKHSGCDWDASIVASSELKQVHSMFASTNDKDLARLDRNYFPNIFKWSLAGGEGVRDDAKSLQLRAASRLLSRQKELNTREANFGLDDLWRMQRQEMYEADLFLNAFHRNETVHGEPTSSTLFTDIERRAILEQVGRDINTKMRV